MIGLGWIKRRLGLTSATPLELGVKLDATAEGVHRVEIQCHAGTTELPVTDLEQLAAYGRRVEESGEEYELAQRDQELVRALLALDPVRIADGTFDFAVRPPVLQYLRGKGQVDETPESRSYEVRSDVALEPRLHVDFDPDRGVSIRSGFGADGTDELAREEDLETTPDGGYVQIGKAFFPFKPPASPMVREWLARNGEILMASEVPAFFKRDLVLLKSEFQAVLTEPAAKVQVLGGRAKARATVNKTDDGWLSVDIEYVGDDYVLPNALLGRADDGFVRLDPFTYVEPDAAEVARVQKAMQPLDAIETDTGFKVRIEQFASLEDFIDRMGGEAELSAEYEGFLSTLTGFQFSEDYRMSEPIEQDLSSRGLSLRGYQRSGIHWLTWLRETHLHGVLADDMGLGKTWQSVFAMRIAYEDGGLKQNSLVVCPKAVLHQWRLEIEKLAPRLRVLEYHGPHRNAGAFSRVRSCIFITTYDVLMRDIERLKATPLFYVILDEATFIKNPNAQRTRAVKALNSAHRVTLSGTPVENRPEELWSQFDFLMRGHLGRFGTFKRLFSTEIVDGNHEATARLGRRIKPFILRRTKDEVAKDLPDKLIVDQWFELTEQQRAYYAQIQDALRSEVELTKGQGKTVGLNSTNILAVLSKLRQVCDHPALIDRARTPIKGRSNKFDAAIEIVSDIAEKGEQVVVFFQFVKVIMDLFANALLERGISYVRLEGSTPNRQAHVDRFQEGGATVAICSLAAMSYGVNLQRANHVIHLGRWWNPAKEDQGTDRVYRLGQDKTVYVYRLMTQGTLEEKIHAMQDRKREVAADIVDAATAGGTSWTQADLLEILKPID